MTDGVLARKIVVHVTNISRRGRIVVPTVIFLAMTAISVSFYRADAVFVTASSLPFYILFFILMYLVCFGVEYLSLWCRREQGFHCARVVVHCLAFMLVSYETGNFFGSKTDSYSHFPTYSVTKVLSHIVGDGARLRSDAKT